MINKLDNYKIQLTSSITFCIICCVEKEHIAGLVTVKVGI